MGRAPCCDKANVKRGPWSPEEDTILKDYLRRHGTGSNWISLPHKAGLKRCGKSCRLRWLNYLRPDIKHGGYSEEEDNIICSLYKSIGSRWSIIASQLPGRTDNDVKNYWNTKLKKKLMAPATTTTPKSKYNLSNTNSSQIHPQVLTSLTNPYTTTPMDNHIQVSDFSYSPPPVLDFGSDNQKLVSNPLYEIGSSSISSSTSQESPDLFYPYLNNFTSSTTWSSINATIDNDTTGGGGAEEYDSLFKDIGLFGSPSSSPDYFWIA